MAYVSPRLLCYDIIIPNNATLAVNAVRKLNRKARMAGTNLGTAWIQIKPSMKGMTSSIRSELSGVGDAGGAEIGSKFSAGFAAKMGAVAGITQQIFGKVTSLISSSFNSAISRVDTLNNFPKVMTSLGYSAESANNSISMIGDSLDGLPTSLDGMAGNVQKLAATMGNLADGTINATTVGLGLNDMLLAGGKGTEIASAAMEQYNQMLANGKVDMQSWRSLVNAAPGQMDQLAKSLLGASANQADLYTAMQKGKITFDQFNEAIVRLDKEGGGGFSSFYDQAVAATGGIATQLENVKNTLNKVVGAALQGNTEDIGKYTTQLVERVGAIAPTLIKGVAGAFKALVEALPGILKELLPVIIEEAGKLYLWIQEFLYVSLPNILVEAIPSLMTAFMNFLHTFIEAIPTLIPQMMTAITNLIITVAQALTSPDFLTLLLQAAFTLFMSIVQSIPQIMVSLINALPEIIKNIVGFLTDPNNIMMIIQGAVQLFMGIVQAVPQILGALLGAFGSLVGSLWDWITARFGEFAASFGNFIGGIFKNAINGVLSFIENVINGPIDILNGFIGVINDAFGWIGVNLGKIDRIQLPRLATGGVVQGIGTDTSDSNIYALSKGEYVIRAAAARNIGYENLDKMNQTGEVSGGQTNYFTINGYNKSPEELANIISRKIAFNQRGVLG